MRHRWKSALAAILGGAQSLHTNARDEALALPSEDAARLALRTQQILAHEAGVTETPDPLGGSWFVESLTSQLEAAVQRDLDEIEALGGTLAAIEALHAAGLLPDEDHDFLRESFRFLRTLQARMRLWSTTARDKLPDDEFALPGHKYPVEDAAHARNAKARAAQQAKAGKLSQSDLKKVDAKADKVLKKG